jgi:hypothetical protein
MAKIRPPLLVSKTVLLLTLLAIISFSFLPIATAQYSVPFRFVQHRLLEGSATPVYRAIFGLKDSAGNYVTDPSVVTSWTLTDSNQNPVTYTNPFFDLYYEEDASYDGATYTTTAPLYTTDDFGATLPGPLVTGTYTFHISLSDGSTRNPTYAFTGEIDLPIISSSSFHVTSDASNLCVQWTPVSPTDWPDTSQRAQLDFFRAGAWMAELNVSVPTGGDHVCIPHSVLKAFTSAIGLFDQAKFRLQLRRNDNGNRSYSSYYPIDLQYVTSYFIDWRFVQRRHYEDSATPVYRAAVALKDSATGNSVTDPGVVTSWVLRDPNGSVVNYTDPQFELYHEEDASYDGMTYTTTAPLYTKSDHYGTLQGPLLVGDYTFEVSFNDGLKLASKYTFNGEVDLPIISFSSFVVSSTSSGDFCVQWQGVSSVNWPNTSQRAIIGFYSGGTVVAELWVVVPTDVHNVCVPASVLRRFTRSIGAYDEARFKVQFRTEDNNNRTISNQYAVNVTVKPVVVPFLELLLGD